ncbi:MAG: molybdopterin-dependent oxidoreductase [Alphaproteobacteria bacterium]|nr:molybdopterin-dependent oxidoreductase [Alphaproteobacteria bacterium]
MGVLNGLFAGDAFFNRLGSSITERTFCGSGAATGFYMTLGEASGMDPESFAQSKYIVIWACNSISTNLHHWPFIAEAQRNGAKVVVIDPLRSRTAKKADWHLAIRPGTDAALALAMMHVITGEGLADDDYIARHTVGFADLKARAEEFPPDKIAAITGIDADDIRQLAREFAGQQPAAIRMGIAIERSPGGRPGGARTQLPAGAGRRLAPCRRRHPVHAGIRLSGQMGRSHPPRLAAPRHPHRQSVATRRRPHGRPRRRPRRRSRPADQIANGL